MKLYASAGRNWSNGEWNTCVSIQMNQTIKINASVQEVSKNRATDVRYLHSH